MASIGNPALNAFVVQIDDELVLAQVVIRRMGPAFELRHISDREQAGGSLRELKPGELRAVAQFTAAGAFRPLKSAPNLQSGWRFIAQNATELDLALHHLYPGAVADWFAAQSPDPPITNYREFVRRQTGMYRISMMLSDAQIARVARAGCHRDFCLKCRLWTVEGVAAEAPADKSLIPCLEPCALLLEFARKAMRIEQEDKRKLELSASDISTLTAAIQTALQHPDPGVREGDFEAPANPRRLRLVLEKLPPAAAPSESTTE